MRPALLLSRLWPCLGALYLLSAAAGEHLFLLVGGSMIWVVLMIINMIAWKRDNPGEPVPLAMFAITATALLWAWSASGVRHRVAGRNPPGGLRLDDED